jgi:hypothetical protein
MNFIAPGAFFLGLLLPVIVAFYLLKLRRVEQEVSSTYLWRRMVRDVEANAPWQRLRFNWLMVLQLLFLAALILALTRPFTWAEGAGGQAAIFILDTSASMSAKDVSPNRLESAKRRAGQLIDDLPDTARVTLIEAGKEANVRLSASLDRRQAHQALDSIQGGTGSSDMAVALQLASAIAARQSGAEVIVLSDGRVAIPKQMNLKGALRYIPFGLSGENLAISMLNLEPEPGNAGLTAFIQVTNYGEKSVSRHLSVLVDGQLVNAFDLAEIDPGLPRSIIAEGLPADSQVVEARLDPSETDALPLDDQAAAVHSAAATLPVQLVTSGNLFIQTALHLLPGVTVTEQQIDRTVDEPGGPPQASATPGAAPLPSPTPAALASTTPALTIFDGVTPDALPSTGNLLFIAPPGATEYFTPTGLVENPTVRAVDPADPLLQNISLDQVSILDAVQIALPAWATPVVAGDLAATDKNGQNTENIPLIFRGEVQGRRIVVIAFDLRHSDLPLQVAFPLLWTNLIDWLAPGAGGIVPPQVNPGETLTFRSPGGSSVPSASVTRPDGKTVPVQTDGNQFVYNDTDQIGLYQLHFTGADQNAPADVRFAVNLFSPQESTLKPAANLPNIAAQTGTASGSQQQSRHEWWRSLAFLALGLLMGEWLVYQRAALVQIKDRLLHWAKFGPPANPPRKEKTGLR